MVGDGPERPMVEELARELDIVADIKFLGKQQDMEEIFAVTDLFLLPSEYESFGLAALEAMASGTAVVCSNAGGLPEIIEQGVCGYMANVGDIQAMSDFSLDILRDENRMAQFQAAAQLQAQRFDIRNIIPIYERLYEKVVSSKG